MKAELFIGEPPEQAIDSARAVYAAAFGRPPYHEGPEQADEFVSRLRRYAEERDGLRLALVDDVAVGLAVLARPGDWWRDRAAEAVGPDPAHRWLGDLCLEVVHLAVHPGAQGLGLGKLTHDLLLAGSPAPTAVLACNPRATPAYGLYQSRGWTTLTESLPFGGSSFLMARDL
jgi:GNAT superfamily N-acetyltransferase